MIKNIWLALGIIFLLFLGVTQLSLSQGFSDSDFTMTNLRVNNNLIELDYSNTDYSNPTYSTLNNPSFYNSYDGSSNTIIGYVTTSHKTYTADAFCLNVGYDDYRNDLYSSQNPSDNEYINSQSGTFPDFYSASTTGSVNRLISINCYDSTQLSIIGSMISSDIVLSEDINTFALENNFVEYGGSVDSYILYNSQKYYFEANSLSLSVSSGDTINLGYEITRDASTPELDPTITLLGSYVEASSSNSEDTQTLDILTTLKASAPSISKENPLRFIGDFFINAGIVIESFIKSLF
jgi:hypothetical protein